VRKNEPTVALHLLCPDDAAGVNLVALLIEDLGHAEVGDRFILLSSSTLLALRSRWITLRHESSWRYSVPRAMPRMMLCLTFQSN
jgi:hypothetical protein